ncbi:S41 family peptidase [Pseudofulvibacter geojedonensis]|uniref:S41 family peptidase n=1 Tax=Pseudofulvibacter geojedonensis TaxID=1123758 RepID=A0ABW3I023_9FLAO
MKTFQKILLLSFVVLALSACFNDQDDTFSPASNTEIGDFIWKAMNAYYLYQGDVTDLADDRFANQTELNTYINTFNNPEALFENLIYNRPTVDKYSWIVSDFEALEASFAGVNKTNGMAFGFFIDPDPSSNKAYGYVRYVTANTDAANKGITRGTIFNTLNGTEITYTNNGGSNTIDSNSMNSLRQDSYEIGLATFDGNTVTATGNSISLTKEELTINPIHKVTTITNGTHKIGYVMYNSFTANFDNDLNNAFASLQTENITSLVLDLRYNSGGSILSAITLSSLITGQFNNQVFSTEEWNNKLQPQFSADELTNKFRNTTRTGAALNSLNLNKVYILTTGRSASASELVISCLRPYIDVVQIGTTTEGKFQASITLYDSPNFSKTNINPGHKYAIQPLVFKSLNSVGFTDYSDGLSPNANMTLAESYNNLGVLGNENEPLLAMALADITGTGRFVQDQTRVIPSIDFKSHSLENTMFADHKEYLFK